VPYHAAWEKMFPAFLNFAEKILRVVTPADRCPANVSVACHLTAFFGILPTLSDIFVLKRNPQ
jgi:uncharacterized membrane protein